MWGRLPSPHQTQTGQVLTGHLCRHGEVGMEGCPQQLGTTSWTQQDSGPGGLWCGTSTAVTRIMSHTALQPRVGACCCRGAAHQLLHSPPQALWLPAPGLCPHPWRRGPPAASAPAVPAKGHVRDALPTRGHPCCRTHGRQCLLCLPLRSPHSRQPQWRSGPCSSAGYTWGCWRA